MQNNQGLILREPANFRLVERAGRYWLECLTGDKPKARRISKRDIHYLSHDVGESFDHACVLDFGLGVFA